MPTEFEKIQREIAHSRAQGKLQQALAFAEQAVALAFSDADVAKQAYALCLRAGVYTDLGKLNDAFNDLSKAQTISETSGDQKLLTTIYISFGTHYRHTGLYPEAVEAYARAFANAQSINDTEGEAIAAGNLGAIYIEQGQWEDAKASLLHAIAIFRKSDKREKLVKMLIDLGIVYEKHGDLDEAYRLYNDAWEYVSTHKLRKMQGAVLGHLAAIDYGRGEIDKASEKYFEAIAIHREIGNLRSEGTILNNYGTLLRSTGQIEEALECYLRAREIHTRLDNLRSQAITCFNIGAAYHELGDFDQAYHEYLKAVEANRNLGYREFEVIALAAYAALRMEQGYLDEANDILEQTVAIARETKQPELSRVLDRIVELKLLRGDGVAAKTLLDEIATHITPASPDLDAMLFSINYGRYLVWQAQTERVNPTTEPIFHSAILAHYHHAKKCVEHQHYRLPHLSAQDFSRFRQHLLSYGFPTEELPLPKNW
ncbi:MAG: tetratricopeptide repeat protein [bacterium]|nr:tetratricopeptide repeat protein [bacterium]